MPIDSQRVLMGGAAAGVVGNVVGFVGFGLLLGPRMQAEAIAVAPAIEGWAMKGAVIATNIAAQFVIGVLMVWLYAAMRPRFGPGMKTAACAALAVWVCGLVFHVDWLLIGMMSTTSYVLASALALVQVLVSAAAGARLYRERAG